MPRTIVLYGGSFDPVHIGHLIAARSVAEARGYRRVTFLPASHPPHKPAAEAGADDRLAMLRLAIQGEDLFDVSSIELERPGRSFTFDTLVALRQAHGPDVALHLLIGTDMLEDLPKWHRAAEVVETAEIVVACRSGWHERTGQILDGLRRSFQQATIDRLRRSLVETPLIDISSSTIRQRLASGRSIRFLVPEAVREYVEAHGLYGFHRRSP